MKELIVGLGEILWDIFPESKVLGGAPANFAYHATQLGGNGFVVSAIGDDRLGREIIPTLQNKGLESYLETTDYPTGTVKVTIDKQGIPDYEIVENVAWDNISFNTHIENIARNTIAVCFGTLAQRNLLSRKTINRFLETIPENCLKIFDINLRQQYYSKEIIEGSLSIANVLKINDEELVILSEMLCIGGNEKDLCLCLLDMYNLNVIILTKGISGSWIFTPDESSFLPTPKVKVVDTVGAGDSFTAAFTIAILNGKPLKEAHTLAVEVSAYVCRQQGAMPQLPKSFREKIIT